jgi:hypothetical protein
MKKIKSAAVVAADHLDWLDDIRPKVNVPNADTNVKHREIVLPLGPG